MPVRFTVKSWLPFLPSVCLFAGNTKCRTVQTTEFTERAENSKKKEGKKSGLGQLGDKVPFFHNSTLFSLKDPIYPSRCTDTTCQLGSNWAPRRFVCPYIVCQVLHWACFREASSPRFFIVEQCLNRLIDFYSRLQRERARLIFGVFICVSLCLLRGEFFFLFFSYMNAVQV